MDKLPPGVSKAQLLIMKKAERENAERVQKLAKSRGRNIRTGLAISAGVFGIYFYTMWAVKQENILDDLDDIHRKNQQKA